jgi:hypothetical protein
MSRLLARRPQHEVQTTTAPVEAAAVPGRVSAREQLDQAELSPAGSTRTALSLLAGLEAERARLEAAISEGRAILPTVIADIRQRLWLVGEHARKAEKSPELAAARRELEPRLEQLLAAHDRIATPSGKTAAIDRWLADDLAKRDVRRKKPAAVLGFYPHADMIESAIGQAVPGAAAVDPDACEERGVPAFTHGTTTFFASESPDLHVAAHEATHVLQHAKRTGDLGLGAEGHAHAVADAVVAGRDASWLLGDGGDEVAPAVRNYTVISESEQNASGYWKAGKDVKVGDQGRTVTTVEQTHEAYADPQLIVEANRILTAKKSGIRITPGKPGPSGPAPDGSGMKQTVKLKYKILGDPKKNRQYPHDCGQAARETMGETGKDVPARGIYKDGAGNRRVTSASKNPAVYRDEILVRTGLGRTVAEARMAYQAMSTTAREAFDKKHGINRHAAPAVGEAFTRKGADDYLRSTEDADHDWGANFHWGGVIMVAGDDRVTFENYIDEEARDEGRSKNEDWYFNSYGSKAGQSWHEQWRTSVGGREELGFTVAAASSADPAPFTERAAAMTTPQLLQQLTIVKNTPEKMALEGELSTRWLEVTVHVKKAQEGTDEVYVKARAGKTYRSREFELSSGKTKKFRIKLSNVMPIKDKIAIEVFDSDTARDDMISNITFKAPYTTTVDNKPWDGATYYTTVKFER